MDSSRPLDDLTIFDLKEDPERWEKLIVGENQRASRDPRADRVLRSCYWESDRAAAFSRFQQSRDFKTTLKLLRRFGIEDTHRIVEIGGGSGFLAWALSLAGFRDVSLLEPNDQFITGTGYLRSRDDAAPITIENSLEKWYESPNTYDVVVTRNCVHHFTNVTWAAAAIRQKLNENGVWVMIREPFIESARQLYEFLHGHPYCQKYNVYEFAYSPSHYVKSLELAGYRLSRVIPARYANDCLSQYSEEEGGRWVKAFTRSTDWALRFLPSTTVGLFRLESMLRSFLRTKSAFFSRPQMLIFRRYELGNIDQSKARYPRVRLNDLEQSSNNAKAA